MRGHTKLVARLGLALGSLLVALVLLEIGLRVAAGFMERERGGAQGAKTILCVGDSHTFGLHVVPALSYPAQLQRALDPTQTSIGVVNYGVPGRNSAALAKSLPGYLDAVRPDVVLVLVGFNDTWNFDATAADPAVAEPAGSSDSADSSAIGDWIASLRVARLARIVRLNLAGRASTAGPRVLEKDGKMMVEEDGELKPAATGGSAFGTMTGAELRARVTRNLERIVALAREHGATPVLLDYATEAQGYFRDLNENARATAAKLGVAFIEVAIPFRAEIARDRYESLFFADDHPNARGNELVARIVAAELVRQGLVTPSKATQSVAPAIQPVLEVRGVDGARVRLRIEGPPNREFQVAFSPRTDPPIEFGGVKIPLGDDPMLARCLENLNLRGRTDGAGRADVEADLARVGAATAMKLFGVVAFFDSATTGAGATGAPDVTVPRTSDRIEIEIR